MMYMIKRGDQEFGPYAGADIQQYLNSGNIVETDLVRAEGSDRWLPVKDILAKKAQAGGVAPVASTPTPTPDYSPTPISNPSPSGDPFLSSSSSAPSSTGFGATGDSWAAPAANYGAPVAAAAAAGYGAAAGAPSGAMKNGAPLPPNMNWVVLIAVGLVTCNIFALVYLFMQAGWVQKLDPQSKGKKFLMLSFAAYGAMILAMILGAVLSAAVDPTLGALVSSVASLGSLAGLVLLILAVFNMRATLEGYFNAVEPINLKLNPILVFFFHVWYFQYHLNRINTWKTTGVLPN